MKILVLGATGETGVRLTKAASQAGHEVTAFARNREKLTTLLGDAMAGLRIHIGDGSEEAALTDAMTDQDVVINAAGNAWDGDSFPRLAQTAIRAASSALGPGGFGCSQAPPSSTCRTPN